MPRLQRLGLISERIAPRYRELGLLAWSALDVVRHLRRLAELLDVDGVDRGRGLELHPGLVALALADQQRAGLGPVGLHERHLERRRLEPVLGRLVARRRRDRLPLERSERVEQ